MKGALIDVKEGTLDLAKKFLPIPAKDLKFILPLIKNIKSRI